MSRSKWSKGARHLARVRGPCGQRSVKRGTAEVSLPYRIVQPYGVRAGEWTLIDTRSTVREAFEALDALSARMVRTGAPADAVELIVVDDADGRARVASRRAVSSRESQIDGPRS